MGNKEQGTARTGGYGEEERVGGRGTFFQKKESHKITYRSGRHKTELDLLICKRKGDVHDPGKYRGITLLSQVLKLLERDLDARIRRGVEGDFGKNSKGSGRGGEQQTGGTS